MLFAISWGYAAYDRNFNPDWVAGTWNPGGNVGANLRTYRYTAKLAREGVSFYGVAPPGLNDWAVYLYPPITVLTYYPFTVLEWMTAYWLLIGLNVIAGLGVAATIVYVTDRAGGELGWLDVVLIAGLLIVSPFTFGTIYYGNINLIIALALVVGFLSLERDRPVVAGVAFGCVAVYKLFPALVGAWLLRVRSWRAIASATAIGTGSVLAGVAVYGWHATATFFSDVLVTRAETATFVGGYPADGTYYVTIQRPLSHALWGAFPTAPPELLTPLTVVIAGGLLVVFYIDVETLPDRLIAIFATMVVTITLIPALQWYLVLVFFPMVPLWYVWEGPGRLLFLAGGAVMFLNVRPNSLVTVIREFGFPPLLEGGLVTVASVATLQLYGLGLMLVACAVAKYGVRPYRSAAEKVDQVRTAVDTEAGR